MDPSTAVTPTQLAKPFVRSFPAYVPGRPIDEVARDLGLDPAGIIKLASNENPFGPSPRAIKAATAALANGQLYPDGGCYVLRRELAHFHGLQPEQFVIGNGSNEIIELLGHVFLAPGDEVVMGQPEFVVYRLVSLLFGAQPVEVPLRDFRNDLGELAKAITKKTKLVILATPNNPTGTASKAADVLAFIRGLPAHVVCVLDEAYCDFAEDPPDLRPLLAEGCKVIGLRTFSKVYGLAALRIGYGYASAELAGLLDRVRQPFNVNAVAQAAAVAALGDQKYARRCVRETRAGLSLLTKGFGALGLSTVPSEANFVLVKVGDSARIFDGLQRRGVIVRPVANYGLPEYLRVTVGTAEQNERLLSELGSVLHAPAKKRRRG